MRAFESAQIPLPRALCCMRGAAAASRHPSGAIASGYDRTMSRQTIVTVVASGKPAPSSRRSRGTRSLCAVWR